VKVTDAVDHRMQWWSFPSAQCLAICVITALSVLMTEVDVFGVKQHRWVPCNSYQCSDFFTSLHIFLICLEVRIYQFLHFYCHCYMYLSVFFFNSLSAGWSPSGSTWHGGHWLAYCTCPGWLWWWRIWWNEDWQEKLKYSEKTRPSATLSTTNKSHLTRPGIEPRPPSWEASD
jgi:hypothetical protein